MEKVSSRSARTANDFDLSEVAKRRTVRLTTTGRRTGQPRTVKIWFVVTGPREIAVQHVQGDSANWYRNLLRNPGVMVDFGDGPLRGRARPVEVREEIEQIIRRIRRKYPLAWLFQLLGTSRAVAVRIEVEPPEGTQG